MRLVIFVRMTPTAHDAVSLAQLHHDFNGVTLFLFLSAYADA